MALSMSAEIAHYLPSVAQSANSVTPATILEISCKTCTLILVCIRTYNLQSDNRQMS
uniref:Uncharacterized protein n=1 Tax=Arion vulgaris TaxID=1028688 RepID=A0A0B6Y984_9EUPU